MPKEKFQLTALASGTLTPPAIPGITGIAVANMLVMGPIVGKYALMTAGSRTLPTAMLMPIKSHAAVQPRSSQGGAAQNAHGGARHPGKADPARAAALGQLADKERNNGKRQQRQAVQQARRAAAQPQMPAWMRSSSEATAVSGVLMMQEVRIMASASNTGFVRFIWPNPISYITSMGRPPVKNCPWSGRCQGLLPIITTRKLVLSTVFSVFCHTSAG